MKFVQILNLATLALVGHMMAPSANALVSLRYAADVPTDQKLLLNSDLLRLSNLQMSAIDPKVLRVFEASSPIDTSFMQSWLQARVYTVVSEKFVLDDSALHLAQENYAFENPGVLPDLPTGPIKQAPRTELTDIQVGVGLASEMNAGAAASASAAAPAPLAAPNPAAAPTPAPTSHLVTVMSNIGGAIYTIGKSKGVLLSVSVPGLSELKVSTPRLGIVKVGKDFSCHLRARRSRTQ